ncbi:reductase [Arthrobacter sp. RIT-PI-e]|uniref:NAD-dependent epimerase/dehydratase family protein n=1 Tax=Arthrobacter sp. RIT-PI-e TaxID=1681197 RepID=UPI000675DFA7|nr:NAD-dependent epimerase/dehydratase family protein [Arthrobacter sp. RIT-PI-e]KNC15060.1 reductase [Arthrobacter sp. RIT-PI-e]
MGRVLILGGTAWLGRLLAEKLIDDGDDVTCLARGTAGPPPAGTTFVRADRDNPDAYAAVRDTAWDEVVELSWDPDHVAGALGALADRAAHWTLVSSVSVYASDAEPDAGETAALHEATDPADYASAKVTAEHASGAALGGRLLVVRAGLISGPGDGSDRFGYWVSRLALAGHGDVLAPVVADRFVQAIDVRDLAGWMIRAGRSGVTGVVNAVGESTPFGTLLTSAREVGGHTGALVEASPEWLAEQGVAYWAGPRSLPLWLPEDLSGFSRRSNAAFRAAGGTLRSLRHTLVDTLDDETARGLERGRRSGLDRREELELLAKL